MTIILLVHISAPAAAAYSVGFQNSTIQITSPSSNDTSVDKVITIEGTSSLKKIFLCVRGPAGEVLVYPVAVTSGSFSKEIWLRFGAGKYTIWAGDNDKQFDGSIRFEVQNNSQGDYRYLAPSGYVNSDSPEIRKIANELVNEKMDDLQKAKAIHDYVAKNVKYNYSVYLSGINQLNTATAVLDTQLGVCRDYAFTFAAIARAAGIPTKVVYGDAINSAKNIEKHAWNEAYVNGQWINIDTTWDAGYIKDAKFVTALSDKYFNIPAETFAKTHTVTSVTTF